MSQIITSRSSIETKLVPNDLIVSKSDKKGRITYANGHVQRISEYSEAELIGQPHRIFRHPDTPRCIFYLLWERLSKKEEVFAFVKNRTKSGGYYWVLANVTTITSTQTGETLGYHSSRRQMADQAREPVEALYATLRAVESRIEHPREAALAGVAALQEHLGSSDWDVYEDWIFRLATLSVPTTKAG